MNHSYHYSTMIHISKITLFILSLILIASVMVLPYFTKSTNYDIHESSTSSSQQVNFDNSPQETKTQTPSQLRKHIPQETMEKDTMLFQGHTQVIISPNPQNS